MDRWRNRLTDGETDRQKDRKNMEKVNQNS